MSIVIQCYLIRVYYLVARATNDRGENSAGSIVSSKAGLHQTRAVVAHKSGSLVVVTHGVGWGI